MRNIIEDRVFLTEKQPIPTPNKWSVVVPQTNPITKRRGLTALGISTPCVAP